MIAFARRKDSRARVAARAINDSFVACQSRGPAKSINMSRARSAARMERFSGILEGIFDLSIMQTPTLLGMTKPNTVRSCKTERLADVLRRVLADVTAQRIQRSGTPHDRDNAGVTVKGGGESLPGRKDDSPCSGGERGALQMPGDIGGARNDEGDGHSTRRIGTADLRVLFGHNPPTNPPSLDSRRLSRVNASADQSRTNGLPVSSLDRQRLPPLGDGIQVAAGALRLSRAGSANMAPHAHAEPVFNSASVADLA